MPSFLQLHTDVSMHIYLPPAAQHCVATTGPSHVLPHRLLLTLADLCRACSFDRTIGTFNVGPFTVPAGQEKAKLKVRVRLNLHGLVGLEGVQAVEEVTEEVEVAQQAAKAAGDAEMKDAAAAEAAGDAGAGGFGVCFCCRCACQTWLVHVALCAGRATLEYRRPAPADRQS
jgi:hypothetical protein